MKESHDDMVEMIHGVEFWVRTFPSWPQRQDYELELGWPTGYWFPEDGIFLEQYDNARDRTFCLVFRRTASKNTGDEAYFLVFLGYKISKDLSRLDDKVWCAVRFCRGSGFKIEDLAREYEPKSEQTSSLDTQDQNEGDGVTLKCWVRIELYGGRGIPVVDILAGETSEA